MKSAQKSIPVMISPVPMTGSIPGVPGRDYPILERAPRTNFQCSGRIPGYYADTEAFCQVIPAGIFPDALSFDLFLVWAGVPHLSR